MKNNRNIIIIVIIIIFLTPNMVVVYFHELAKAEFEQSRPNQKSYSYEFIVRGISYNMLESDVDAIMKNPYDIKKIMPSKDFPLAMNIYEYRYGKPLTLFGNVKHYYNEIYWVYFNKNKEVVKMEYWITNGDYTKNDGLFVVDLEKCTIVK